MKTQLSDTQIEHFEEQGYLRVDDLIPHTILDNLETEINETIDRCTAQLIQTGELTEDFKEFPFSKRLIALNSKTSEIHRAVRASRLCGAGIFGLLTAPSLLDIAQQLCGEEVVASSVYRLRPKLPGEKLGEVPWHQDSGYFEPSCDNSLVLTVWVPLVSATREMGCLWLIPRVHKGSVYRHSPHENKISLEIKKEDLPCGEAPICVPVNRGGVLLMSNKTPHASFANNSDLIRWSVDLRYQSASLPTNAVLPYSSTARDDPEMSAGCFPPEPDFLVRSALHPEAVLKTPVAFRHLRESYKAKPLTDRWAVHDLTKQGLFRKLNG